MKRVKVINEENETLIGDLYEAGGESKGLVIMCHGFGGSKDYFIFSELTEGFNEEGWDVYRFDFSGNGESEGVFGESGPVKERSDLKSVINHFEDYESIILLGHSLGGCVVLISGGVSERVKGVITFNAVILPSITMTDSLAKYHPSNLLRKADISEVQEKIEEQKKESEKGISKKLLKKADELMNKVRERFVLTQSFFNQMKEINVVEEVKEWNKPLLLIHGRLDKLIPLSHAEYLYEQVKGPKKLIAADYFHHFIPSSEKSEIMNGIKSWMKKHFS